MNTIVCRRVETIECEDCKKKAYCPVWPATEKNEPELERWLDEVDFHYFDFSWLNMTFFKCGDCARLGGMNLPRIRKMEES